MQKKHQTQHHVLSTAARGGAGNPPLLDPSPKTFLVLCLEAGARPQHHPSYRLGMDHAEGLGILHSSVKFSSTCTRERFPQKLLLKVCFLREKHLASLSISVRMCFMNCKHCLISGIPVIRGRNTRTGKAVGGHS